MRALAVTPGIKDSLALRDVPEPPDGEGQVLVEALAVGLCGTDSEIIMAEYGEAPPGQDYLVLGHENLGRVIGAHGFGFGQRRPGGGRCPPA
jgi:threonine dehydrogenase-like Zn-dependent dehydrogenase